jgi:uncharacterized membrane protein YcaP (DUF421 family)
MDSVLRGTITYVVLWLIFRVTGKRALSEITTFDFVLLLIVSETTQASLMDNNGSMTNTFLLIITMIGIDVVLSLWRQRSHTMDKIMEGTPLVILENGVPIRERLEKSGIDEEDILEAARQLRGLERLEQIKYAVRERHGGITIIAKDASALLRMPG